MGALHGMGGNKVLIRISIGLAGCLALATASVAQTPSFGTSVAECRGNYDYASLLPPDPAGGFGLDTRGITVFGGEVTMLTSEYSNEWDEERYVYTSRVSLDYPTLRQRALAAHGAAECIEESNPAGGRLCRIAIAKPKTEFQSVTLWIEEDGPNSVATCTLDLASG